MDEKASKFFKWGLMIRNDKIKRKTCSDRKNSSNKFRRLFCSQPSFTPLTAILFTIELFVIVVNVSNFHGTFNYERRLAESRCNSSIYFQTYATLCVFSQYQEYKAGRGTAAYDILLESVRMLPHVRFTISANCRRYSRKICSRYDVKIRRVRRRK